MKDILNFLIQHWRIIASGIIILLNLLILITRKRSVKVVNTFMADLYQIVLNAIKLAEEKIGSGHGASKKELVIELVLKAFNEKYGPSVNTDPIVDLASALIEEILSTPQKKGD